MIKVIENFLPHKEAVILSNNIYNTPSNWWTYAYRHNESKNVVNLGDNLFGQNGQRAEEEKIRRKNAQRERSHGKEEKGRKGRDDCTRWRMDD